MCSNLCSICSARYTIMTKTSEMSYTDYEIVYHVFFRLIVMYCYSPDHHDDILDVMDDKTNCVLDLLWYGRKILGRMEAISAPRNVDFSLVSRLHDYRPGLVFIRSASLLYSGTSCSQRETILLSVLTLGFVLKAVQYDALKSYQNIRHWCRSRERC